MALGIYMQWTGLSLSLVLQHISAPLLEFERQKIIKRFTKVVPATEEGGEEGGKETSAIDYQ